MWRVLVPPLHIYSRHKTVVLTSDILVPQTESYLCYKKRGVLFLIRAIFWVLILSLCLITKYINCFLASADYNKVSNSLTFLSMF